MLRATAFLQTGSTFVNLVEYYVVQLKASGGKLILAGVHPRVKEQLDLTETTQDVLGEENIFLATENIAESMLATLKAAHAWLDKAADA